MAALFASVEYWFGLAIVIIHQISRFNELGSLNSSHPAYSTAIPELRANDFIAVNVYVSGLVVFLLFSVLVYTGLCFISPTLIVGLLRVAGASTSSLEQVTAAPFPLYVAATLVGLTNSIPLLPNLSAMQRDLFHWIIGVPRRLVQVSQSYLDQLVARSPGREQLEQEVASLTADGWIGRIGKYADTRFYGEQLQRLDLHDDLDEDQLLKRSRRELKLMLGQLVYSASIAAARKSGRSGLLQLAHDLGVSPPARSHHARVYFLVALLFVVVMVLLLFVIPMFDGLASAHLQDRSDFWPDSLGSATTYLFANAVPIFLATLVALALWHRGQRDRSDRTEPVGPSLELFAPILVSVMLLVVVFDVLQAIYQYGYNPSAWRSLLAFMGDNTPFYLLHSLIAVAVVSGALFYAGATRIGTLPAIGYGVATAIAAGLMTLVYGAMRLYYQFGCEMAFDYLSLIAAISIVAAGLSFIASVVFVNERHRRAVAAA